MEKNKFIQKQTQETEEKLKKIEEEKDEYISPWESNPSMNTLWNNRFPQNRLPYKPYTVVTSKEKANLLEFYRETFENETTGNASYVANEVLRRTKSCGDLELKNQKSFVGELKRKRELEKYKRTKNGNFKAMDKYY
jgi:hypothetical protein